MRFICILGCNQFSTEIASDNIYKCMSNANPKFTATYQNTYTHLSNMYIHAGGFVRVCLLSHVMISHTPKLLQLFWDVE